MEKNSRFKFIDLFSGIGGFHQAMKEFGGECVLASEIDANAIKVYLNNYNIDSNRDIRAIKEQDIPNHDVLCAGFPCQTFSKAGKRAGFLDKTRGTLFFEIVRILNAKHPKYILLENVRNLVSHDNGNTYKTICSSLKELGYRIPDKPLILSPHQFGVPQVRERIFIPGFYDPDHVEEPLEIKFEGLLSKSENSIFSICDPFENDKKYQLSNHTNTVLNAWDEFYKGIDIKTIGFPIWFDYFDKQAEETVLPDRKATFIRKNNELYQRNKNFIDAWSDRWKVKQTFTQTERKFEWQAGQNINSLWEGVIQFRPSGIRVKKPDIFQALVALVQTPIIGPYKRKLSLKEAARLQSFPDDFIPDDNMQQAYKQFGNAVNVLVVKEVFKKLIKATATTNKAIYSKQTSGFSAVQRKYFKN